MKIICNEGSSTEYHVNIGKRRIELSSQFSDLLGSDVASKEVEKLLTDKLLDKLIYEISMYIAIAGFIAIAIIHLVC